MLRGLGPAGLHFTRPSALALNGSVSVPNLASSANALRAGTGSPNSPSSPKPPPHVLTMSSALVPPVASSSRAAATHLTPLRAALGSRQSTEPGRTPQVGRQLTTSGAQRVEVVGNKPWSGMVHSAPLPCLDNGMPMRPAPLPPLLHMPAPSHITSAEAALAARQLHSVSVSTTFGVAGSGAGGGQPETPKPAVYEGFRSGLMSRDMASRNSIISPAVPAYSTKVRAEQPLIAAGLMVMGESKLGGGGGTFVLFGASHHTGCADHNTNISDIRFGMLFGVSGLL